jgi:hypothetical protein
VLYLLCVSKITPGSTSAQLLLRLHRHRSGDSVSTHSALLTLLAGPIIEILIIVSSQLYAKGRGKLAIKPGNGLYYEGGGLELGYGMRCPRNGPPYKMSQN